MKAFIFNTLFGRQNSKMVPSISCLPLVQMPGIILGTVIMTHITAIIRLRYIAAQLAVQRDMMMWENPAYSSGKRHKHYEIDSESRAKKKSLGYGCTKFC